MFGGVGICDVLASDMASVICDDVTINSDRSQKIGRKIVINMSITTYPQRPAGLLGIIIVYPWYYSM